MRTSVVIIGGGPGGLLLARLLHQAGIDSVVLESRDRAYVEQRQRAGILEHGTAEVLRRCGAGARMDREGLPHEGIELRFGRRAHRIDFPSRTGGHGVLVYAQTEVVRDLIALQLAEGGPLLFEATALAVEGTHTERPSVRFRQGAQESILACDYVVGFDGFHGLSRHAVPDGAAKVFERDYPYSWLGVLADVPPSCEELIYARSERGFALHSMRSPQVSRLYLQVPNGTDPDDWPAGRIWDELDARFAVDADWTLRRGPISSTDVLPMRASVTEPMRHGRLLLAGDAAHIVPPTGAKGLNLAAADAVTLARAFTALHRHGSNALLDTYSDTALRRAWRAQHFSYAMTSTLHIEPHQTPFASRLQTARLERLCASEAAASELAANYTGLSLV